MIAIGGATATGKSEIAIKLAKEYNGEIISADSMQIYKYMDIGTAKINKIEQDGIIHHMVDIKEPYENFSVAEYYQRAKEIIIEIEKKKKLPILVGGTGLYINSLLFDYKTFERDENLRAKLINEYEINGIDYMYNKLMKYDHQAAEVIHKNNIKRVIRALEVKILTGKSITDNKNKNSNSSNFPLFVINTNRDILYEKINKRVELMFEKGLPDEVEKLLQIPQMNFDCQSMQAIGYKEFRGFYNNTTKILEVKENIKQHTRNYAKRQITWFKGINDAIWINDFKNVDEVVDNLKLKIEKYIGI